MTDLEEWARNRRVYGVDCFKCIHAHWDYYYDCPFPIVRQLVCDLKHEQTSYNTNYGETFECGDFTEKSYNNIVRKVVEWITKQKNEGGN